MLETILMIFSSHITVVAGITIRKEVRDLTKAEWEVFTSTIVTALKFKDEGMNNSIWIEHVNLHRGIYNKMHNNW